MLVLSSTGSFGDTKILERYQEQLNKLEKLHFNGKPAKIKRYRCVEEYVYLDEKGNIIATEVTSSTQPLPLYEPFGGIAGSSSSTTPRATQTKTMESLPPLKTKYSVEELMLERATSMLTTTTELPLLKPPAIDTTTQQMPFLPPPNGTFVATESSTLGKSHNPAGLIIRRIRPHNLSPTTEKSRSESRNVVHSGSDRSADRLSVGGSQSPSSPLFTAQKEIRRSYEFRPEKGEKPTHYNTNREYGDYHYDEDDHEYPLPRPELRRHSAYRKKAYMEDFDDDDYYWESKKSRLPHRSFARTTMRYPLLSRQRPIPTMEDSGSAEMTPENCAKVMSYAKLFGVPNPQAWVHDNCAFVQTFVQAPCNDINKFVDSCFKRKFL
ncbi:hypothetical protein AAVH_02765 [Aphelenchoides avenae]|nr:hypothetical protein AAVH_02765 [Aphelenchus avenae]